MRLPRLRRRNRETDDLTAGYVLGEQEPQRLGADEAEAFRLYADTATVIVRWTPEARVADPEYRVAVVGRFAVGGPVPFDDLRDPILRWLNEEAGYGEDRHYEIRRRNFDEGASGAEAVLILSLLSGAAGGIAGKLAEEAFDAIRARLAGRVDHLQPMTEYMDGEDDLRHALARAIDVRASDLKLIEHRANDERAAAAFETPSGQVYGVRIGSVGVTIRALEPGEY
jgi:hypothetical protein